MPQHIDHYSREPNMPALKRVLDVYERAPGDALPQLTYLAESGSPMSMIFLGYAYRDGAGVGKDLVQAETWFRRAADVGSVMALHELGCLYMQQKRSDEAKHAFRFAAAAGHAPAVHQLGRMYFFGLGVEKDIARAKTLLEDASASGNIFATRLLGHLLIHTHLDAAELFQGILLTTRSFIDFWIALFVEGLGSDSLATPCPLATKCSFIQKIWVSGRTT